VELLVNAHKISRSAKIQSVINALVTHLLTSTSLIVPEIVMVDSTSNVSRTYIVQSMPINVPPPFSINILKKAFLTYVYVARQVILAQAHRPFVSIIVVINVIILLTALQTSAFAMEMLVSSALIMTNAILQLPTTVIKN